MTERAEMTGNEVADIALRRLEWVRRHIEKRCQCRSDASCRKNARAELLLTIQVMRECKSEEPTAP